MVYCYLFMYFIYYFLSLAARRASLHAYGVRGNSELVPEDDRTEASSISTRSGLAEEVLMLVGIVD